MSSEPYDTWVAGVVSGAGGIEPGLTLTPSVCALISKDPVKTGPSVASVAKHDGVNVS